MSPYTIISHKFTRVLNCKKAAWKSSKTVGKDSGCENGGLHCVYGQKNNRIWTTPRRSLQHVCWVRSECYPQWQAISWGSDWFSRICWRVCEFQSVRMVINRNILSDIAKSQPHAAFSALTHGLLNKWTYLSRVVPDISHLLVQSPWWCAKDKPDTCNYRTIPTEQPRMWLLCSTSTTWWVGNTHSLKMLI